MKRRSDEEISAPLYAFDAEVRSQYGCFAGVERHQARGCHGCSPPKWENGLPQQTVLLFIGWIDSG